MIADNFKCLGQGAGAKGNKTVSWCIRDNPWGVSETKLGASSFFLRPEDREVYHTHRRGILTLEE